MIRMMDLGSTICNDQNRAIAILPIATNFAKSSI